MCFVLVVQLLFTYLLIESASNKYIHVHICSFDFLYTKNQLTCTLTNSDVPDEMPHDAAFHQCLYCLLMKKDLQIKTQYIF